VIVLFVLRGTPTVSLRLSLGSLIAADRSNMNGSFLSGNPLRIPAGGELRLPGEHKKSQLYRDGFNII
jgi:hypothetical protein